MTKGELRRLRRQATAEGRDWREASHGCEDGRPVESRIRTSREERMHATRDGSVGGAMTRAQRLATRLEAQARALPCVRGVPLDRQRARTIARRYRVVLNVLKRDARNAFTRNLNPRREP